MSDNTKTLGEALPEECARVRGLIERYKDLENLCPQANCKPVIMMMEQALQKADKAMVSGDVAAMVGCYKRLQGFMD